MPKPSTIALGLLAALLAMALPAVARAGGIIINEVSNGPAGAQEYFELLVTGSSASPTASVSLDGWILDDNNGSWGGSTTGVGISDGYARFSASASGCGSLAAVPPGSLIVVYNPADPYPGLPADDLTDANGDHTFVIPATSVCLTTCPGPPLASDSGYSSCAPAATQSYLPLQLRNAGDAAQTRNPAAALFHGFVYGDIPAPTPAGSFNVDTASGTAKAYILSCGDWSAKANFAAIPSTGGTPGSANNSANTIMIQKIRAGTFDYANPSATANCQVLTDVRVTLSSLAIDDHVSASAKDIPGADLAVSISLANFGQASPDANSVVLREPIPATQSLFVSAYSGGSPISYADGTIGCGLSLTYTSPGSTTDSIDFSSDGGANFTYVPVPDADGFDPLVNAIRIRPAGTLAAATVSAQPSCSFGFKARIH